MTDRVAGVRHDPVDAAVRSGETRLLGDAMVRGLLSLEACVEVQREALIEIARGERGGIRCGVRSESGTSLAAMIAVSENDGVGVVKALTASRRNRERGLPRSQSTFVLTAVPSGFPIAVVAGTYLTAARTAATAYLAVETLASRRDRRIGLFGAGPLATTFVEILAAKGGDWDVAVFAPTREHREALADRFEGRRGVVVRASPSAREAAHGRPTLVAFTDGTGHFVDPHDVADDALVVSMASRSHTSEVPPEFVRTATIYVDDPVAAPHEAAEFAEGVPGPVRAIGSALSDGSPDAGSGRRLFKAVGTAYQDAVGASTVWRAAVRDGVGHAFRFLD